MHSGENQCNSHAFFKYLISTGYFCVENAQILSVMNHFIKVTLALLCLISQSSYSQDKEYEVQLTSKDSVISRSWHVGIGYNIIDDSGDVFDELFSVGDQWNALPYPSRINIGRYFKSGLGVEAIGSYNKYKVGKLIDGEINQEEMDYYAIDSRLTYDLMRLFGRDSWFDPYVGVGLGYTSASEEPRGTYNAVVGLRTWITEKIALDLNSSGKWRMGNVGTNHLQHAASVVYRFGIEKELSNKGEEKLAQIEALLEKRQEKQDSLEAARRSEEALAQEFARKKLLAEQQAAQKDKIAAEKARKKRIIDEINALGHVYFALNSSYLSADSKEVLNGLSDVMNKYPQLELEISSHTDSRGTNHYNSWLSERRVERTLKYLLKLGVSKERLQAQAKGEEELLNECDDTTYCDEEKHKVNRRSEFVITKF